MIRGKYKNCPYGLPITKACNSIGGIVNHLIKIDKDSSNQELESNYRVYLSIDEPKKCPFADRTFKEKKSVDCKWNEDVEVLTSGNDMPNGSPLYPHLYVGNSTKSLQSYPLNYYSDDNIRSIYYGLFGLLD
jgi:hypothetical protein